MSRFEPGDLVEFQAFDPTGKGDELVRECPVRARLVSFEPTAHGQAIVQTMDGVRHALRSPSVRKVVPS